MITGIGPVYAKKLVDRFGEKIFDIIETMSKKLEEVEGIGPSRDESPHSTSDESRAGR